MRLDLSQLKRIFEEWYVGYPISKAILDRVPNVVSIGLAVLDFFDVFTLPEPVKLAIAVKVAEMIKAGVPLGDVFAELESYLKQIGI